MRNIILGATMLASAAGFSQESVDSTASIQDETYKVPLTNQEKSSKPDFLNRLIDYHMRLNDVLSLDIPAVSERQQVGDILPDSLDDIRRQAHASKVYNDTMNDQTISVLRLSLNKKQ